MECTSNRHICLALSFLWVEMMENSSVGSMPVMDFYVMLEQSHMVPINAILNFCIASVISISDMSISSDGTISAHDVHCCCALKTLMTLTAQIPIQFFSLAVEPSNEIVKWEMLIHFICTWVIFIRGNS